MGLKIPISDFHVVCDGFYPVCERCLVKCVKHHKDDHNGRITWFECPICKNGDPQSSINECELTEEELDGNLRFLTFMNGKE